MSDDLLSDHGKNYSRLGYLNQRYFDFGPKALFLHFAILLTLSADMCVLSCYFPRCVLVIGSSLQVV